MTRTRPGVVGAPQPPRKTSRRGLELLAVLAVVLAGAGVFLGVRHAIGSRPSGTPSATAPPSAAPSATAAASPLPTASAPASTSSGTPTSGSPSPSGATTALGGLMPLWPFSSQAGADAWLSEYRSGGHQPWHRDADLTAQVFTTGFLGFAVVNDVLAVNERADGAHVDVGYHDPAGQTHIAATVHLVKYGTAPDSPWEVVGTDDSSLTVDQPRYGSTVTSPVTVGGRITGVDENIVVSIRQSWSPQPLGTAAGLPAGGERAPWSQTVSFAGTRPGALTIVASTGGHLQDVERFAVQGVLAKAGA